jgi:hypothetical protein
MKHIYLAIAALFFVTAGLQAQRNCGTMEHLHHLQEADPGLMERMQKIENHTRFMIQTDAENVSRNTSVIRIPVVVHVVYRTTTENISVSQIQSQIDVLNADFRRTNSDASQTLSQFQGVAADSEIEFCLASVDPSGNPTSGITRTATTKTSFGTNNSVKFNAQGGKDAWPRDSYLNMWVCNIGGSILGYAQFPGGSASTDGVVMDYRYFGTNGTATAPFNLGRTATHEVGHWLNLRHIWGDGGCSVDDFVSDTPGSDSPNYGCSLNTVKCGSLDMVQNYMDYTDDGCMNIFTAGQKTRMRAVLAPGGFRAPLLNSTACGAAPQPSCFDGIQNGDETGVDCGGSCAPCAVPSGCLNYCASRGNSTVDEFIQSVTIGAYSNNSGNNNGYASFNTTASYQAGQSYTFTLVPGWSGTVYPEYFRIWADWNRNGVFTDASELIYDQGSASTATTRTGSFTVPVGQSAGRVTFRVQMKYNAAPTSCETFSWGEVEDYCVDITAAAPVCGIPSGLNSSSITNAQATLSWTAVSGATSYTLRARQIGTATWASGTTSGTTLNYTGLSACTDYEFQVSATCGTISSDFSASSNFSTIGCVQLTCDVPSGLSASGISGTQATLNWTAVSGAASYNVRARPLGSTSWSTGNVTSTSVNFTGLTSCTGYEFEVQAVCSNGLSSNYSEASNFISTGCTTCGAPTVAYVDNITTTSARFNWSSMGSATSYTLRFRRTGTTTWTRVSTSATSLTRTGLLCGTGYQYQLRARCSGRWSSYGTTRTFTTASCNKESEDLAVIELQQERFDANVYPNPANEVINIEFMGIGSDEKVNVKIVDLSGRIMFDKDILTSDDMQAYQIETERFINGIYLIRLTSGTDVLTKRVVVSK